MIESATTGGLTRREVLRTAGAAGALLMSHSMAWPGTFQDVPDRSLADVDHVMWGSRDLDAGIALLEAKLGVKAAFGGVHPGRGTRNALLSLGEGHYLEIIAPDPAQAGARDPRVTQLAGLAAPRILTWAAGTRDIDALEARLRAAGVRTSGVVAGARERPDGTTLRWKTLSVSGHESDVVPFLIQWDPASRHPSLDSPRGCTIRELRLEHPDAARVNRLFETMGLRVRARRGTHPGITALLSTLRGEMELT